MSFFFIKSLYLPNEACEMRIGVLGLNHEVAHLKLREKLAIACNKLFRTGSSLHIDHYFILLSTCNRTEIYFTSEDLTSTHTYLLQILRSEVEEDFDHKLYSYFGSDCFSHLVRVTAGLDSAIIAETEIQGQVKNAYEQSIQYQSYPKEMHALFQKSLGIAKKIRSELQLGRGMPNLEHAIYSTGKHFFKTPENQSVLFVGASDINQKILCFLANKGISNISLCNRSPEKSLELKQKFSINILEWDHLNTYWNHFDWIIFGTKATHFLIKGDSSANVTSNNKLIMDLSVPRNVDPLLGKHSHITLMNIDQINRLLKIRKRNMNRTLEAAEEMVQKAIESQFQRFQLKEQSKLSLLSVSA